jgi:hypothetical protein
MLNKLATLAACASLASAIPFWPELEKRQGTPLYPDNGTLVDPPNVTTLTRPNPSYTTEQLNQVKLALTETEKLTILKSFGNVEDYFKFDLTPNGSQSNAANGLGGQGYLAHVGNFPGEHHLFVLLYHLTNNVISSRRYWPFSRYWLPQPLRSRQHPSTQPRHRDGDPRQRPVPEDWLRS